MSPLTVFGPISIGPACICCCALLRWDRQAASRFARSGKKYHLALFFVLFAPTYVGTVAFSRTDDPNTGEFGDAIVIKKIRRRAE
jgi:hypothetical protein